MVRMLGIVVLRVMVLRRGRLPELGLLQMAIVGVLGCPSVCVVVVDLA